MAPKSKLAKSKGSSSNTTINALYKASNAPVDLPLVEKVPVELHAEHSIADGNRAVTSEVNRTAIWPIVTGRSCRAPQTPNWKSWVTQDSKTGKNLFLAKGLHPSPNFYKTSILYKQVKIKTSIIYNSGIFLRVANHVLQ